MTDSLVQRLREAIDETQRIAQAAGGEMWRGSDWPMDECRVETADGDVVVYDEGAPTAAQAAHIIRQNPKVTLDRCAADRKILDLHAPWSPDLNGLPLCQICHGDGTYGGSGPCDTVVLLAEACGIEA